MKYPNAILFSFAFSFLATCKEIRGFPEEAFPGDESLDLFLERSASASGPHLDAINLCKQQIQTQKLALDTQTTECTKKIERIESTVKESKKSCSIEINLEKESCNSKLLQLNKTLNMGNPIKNTPNSQAVDCNKPCKLPVKRLGKPIKSLLNISSGSSGYYYVSKPNEKENWFMADFQCKYNGFELASLETEEEHNKLTKALGGEIAEFWLSGTDLGSESRFYWAGNGKSLTNFANFDLGQPDNKDGKEHCLNLKLNQIQSPPVYRWDDSRCDKKLRYICEVATIA